jgi:hypothetical protein
VAKHFSPNQFQLVLLPSLTSFRTDEVCASVNKRKNKKARRIHRIPQALKLICSLLSAPLWQKIKLQQFRLDLLRVHSEILDRLRDHVIAYEILLRQGVQRPNDRALRVHREKPAQPRARIASAETVRTQRE